MVTKRNFFFFRSETNRINYLQEMQIKPVVTDRTQKLINVKDAK